MARKTPVELGQIFLDNEMHQARWRVQKLLLDGVHAVIVDAAQPIRRKTLAISVLTDRKRFVEAPGI
jgi:hypothetical protein